MCFICFCLSVLLGCFVYLVLVSVSCLPEYKHTCEVSLLTVYNTWWTPNSGAYQFEEHDDEKAPTIQMDDEKADENDDGGGCGRLRQ